MDELDFEKKKDNELKWDKRLPIIMVNEEKAKMIYEWYINSNELKTLKIPYYYNEGYFIYNNNGFTFDENNEFVCQSIKMLAHETKSTYNEVKRELQKYVDMSKQINMYYKVEENILIFKIYTSEMMLVEGTTEEDMFVDSIDKIDKTNAKSDFLLEKSFIFLHGKEFIKGYARKILNLFAGVCFYLSVQKNMKIQYDFKQIGNYKINEPPKIKKSKKGKREIIIKSIETPICDLSKKRIVVKNLTKRIIEYKRRTEAWEVCGHYRQYSNGTRIWVKPYIKGDKNKIQRKVILVDPQNKK